MLKTITRLFKDRAGPTAIEYGLLAALIAVVTIAGLTTLGKNLNTQYQTISNKVGS